ncbi:MAG: hypothetical protein RR576_03245 [Oscillospiraceae bacterium]
MYYNIKIGILGQWKKPIIVICVIILFCFGFYNNIQSTETLKSSFFDYYIYIFQGEAAASLNRDAPYVLPVIPILLWILLSFCVGDFPVQELQTQAEQTLLRCKNRSSWWLSKTIWNAIIVLLFYISIVCTVLMFSVCTGTQQTLTPNYFLHQLLFTNPPNLSVAFIIASIIVPIVVSISLTQMQLTLSLIVGSVGSYLVIFAYFICAAYINSPWFIGNGMMLIRNRFFTDLGCSSSALITISIVYWIVSFLVGRLIFRRYNILKKMQE